jgi:hypothetical protein
MLEIVIVVELVLRDYVEATVIAVLLIFNPVLSFLQQLGRLLRRSQV